MKAVRQLASKDAVKVVAVVVVLMGTVRTGSAAAQTRPAAPATHAVTQSHLITPVSSEAWAVATAGTVALASGITLYLAPIPGQGGSDGNHWRGGILFDEGARNALRFGSAGDRATAATASDIAMVSTMALATWDAVGVPLLQGDVDLSWQAGFAYSLALGTTLTIGEIFKDTVGRARPYERDCALDPTGPGCGTANAYQSFYSLHTSVAFASAGFSCAMHLSRSLYGDGLADATSCATSLALATGTGLLRVMADQHYLSDVLVGGLIGFIIGYVVPLIFVPDRRVTPGHADTGFSAAVTPNIQPGPGGGTYGINVVGQF